jgi:uncharacterized protein
MGRGDSSAEFGGVVKLLGSRGRVAPTVASSRVNSPVKRLDSHQHMRVIEFKTHPWGHPAPRFSEPGSGGMEIPFATFPAGPEKDGEHGDCNRVAPGVTPGAAPTEIRRAAPSFGAWLLLAFLRFYIIFLSPVFGGACKFYPSCSNYAIEAVTKHGARRGFLLAAKRLLRCRPFTQGGFDPVPDDLPHCKQPSFAEEKARVFTKTDSRIQRTERRIL